MPDVDVEAGVRPPSLNPTCPEGHGPMVTTGKVSTGLWPGFVWICSLWRTCPAMEREAVRPL